MNSMSLNERTRSAEKVRNWAGLGGVALLGISTEASGGALTNLLSGAGFLGLVLSGTAEVARRMLPTNRTA